MQCSRIYYGVNSIRLYTFWDYIKQFVLFFNFRLVPIIYLFNQYQLLLVAKRKEKRSPQNVSPSKTWTPPPRTTSWTTCIPGRTPCPNSSWEYQFIRMSPTGSLPLRSFFPDTDHLQVKLIRPILFRNPSVFHCNLLRLLSYQGSLSPISWPLYAWNLKGYFLSENSCSLTLGII